MSMTTISCDADKDYVTAIKLVALRRGVKVGTLVRQALDASHASEIAAAQRAAASFFESDGAYEFQSEHDNEL